MSSLNKLTSEIIDELEAIDPKLAGDLVSFEDIKWDKHRSVGPRTIAPALALALHDFNERLDSQEPMRRKTETEFSTWQSLTFEQRESVLAHWLSSYLPERFVPVGYDNAFTLAFLCGLHTETAYRATELNGHQQFGRRKIDVQSSAFGLLQWLGDRIIVYVMFARTYGTLIGTHDLEIVDLLAPSWQFAYFIWALEHTSEGRGAFLRDALNALPKGVEDKSQREIAKDVYVAFMLKHQRAGGDSSLWESKFNAWYPDAVKRNPHLA
jgi:hypothetical protein